MKINKKIIRINKIVGDFKEAIKKQRKQTFSCECIKCNYKVRSEKHCIDIKCSKCGGKMRRTTRSGLGR